jgi:hypothetical protein
VRFTGSGYDPDGVVQKYQFNFGDTSGGQPQVWEQDGSEASHRYENPGTFVITLKVKDSHGNWVNDNSDCRKTVTIYGKPQVLGAETPPTLPKTGVDGLAILLGSLPIFSGGIYLYRRFKLA